MTLIAGACGPGATQWVAAMLRTEAGASVDRDTLSAANFAACGNAGGPALWREGDLIVAANARIDDRAALLRRLGLSAELPDAALIAHAWLRWGADAPDALIGDYAFAVFDARSEALWLVRDALGFRPLCFATRGGDVGFASLPSRLASGKGVTPELVSAALGGSRMSPQSWFAGVEQVRPGERVRLRPDGATRTLWWQPSTAPGFTGTRDDLRVAIGEALDAAVADRVGDVRCVATHLSAGLDSMAVTVTVARKLPASAQTVAITARPSPRHAWTGPPGRMLDESHHAAAVAARCGVRHVIVEADGRSIADDLHAAASRFEGPLTNPANFGWLDASCQAARDAGADRLLIAQMGNYGFSPEADGYWEPLLRREGAARLFAEWRRCANRAAPLREMARRLAGRHVSLAETRLAVMRQIDPGLMLKGFAREGLEISDPTADRRVIELALTVPENLLVRDGDRRWVARRLLRGAVPDTVLDEPQRGYQAADWLSRLRAEADVLGQMLVRAETQGGTSFRESRDLLRAIAARSDVALDAAARTRLAPDLAIAAFVLAQQGDE